MSLTILVVEDRQAVSDALKGTLEAEGWREAAYRAGVDVFLKKPEDVGRLVEAVRELTQRRRGKGA